MGRISAWLLGALALGAAPLALAADPPPATSPARAGFLSDAEMPNAIAILPPPPQPGSPSQAADVAVIKSTRALKGTARWTLAAHDAVNYIGAFDCALGVAVTPKTTPKTAQLLGRVGADAGRIMETAKERFMRPRPFIGSDIPICVENQRPGLAKSYSYPSGHATYSWAVGLLLAEMEPERASEILARARAFGESRVVCGVHFPSDIEAGRTTGSALVAALHADPGFQAAFSAAKAELADAEAGAHASPDAATCALDKDAEIHTPWTNPETGK